MKKEEYLEALKTEFRTLAFWRDVISEFVATFFLVSVQVALPLKWGSAGLGGPVQLIYFLWEYVGGVATFIAIFSVGIGMGFVVCCMAWTLGDFGGGHMNPAVSFAMAICLKITFTRGYIMGGFVSMSEDVISATTENSKRLADIISERMDKNHIQIHPLLLTFYYMTNFWKENTSAILYILAQCLGGLVGAAYIYGLTPEAYRDNLATTTLGPDVTAVQGVFLEAWITCQLVITILGSTNSDRKDNVYMATIPIGFSVALGIMSGFGSTGGSMNPARSFGPAVVSGIWSDHWVYWLGPLIGAAVAVLIYHLFDKVGSRKTEPLVKNTQVDPNA